MKIKLFRKYPFLILLLVTFLIRLYNLSFPYLTSDEARVADRGYVLAATGKDELGRLLPTVFNSLNDYQLPTVSYLTALGMMVFGKTDLGARIPFILIGTGVVFLIYKISRYFADETRLGFYAAAIASFSPGLIFFSKFPNEFILSTFLTLFLISQILKERINIFIILTTILLMLLTSKVLWFMAVPVLILSVLLNSKISRGEKIMLIALDITLTVVIILFYLRIPQAGRSLVENNLAILNDVTVKNGIEKLRSQQIWEWPIFLDRILFNKAYMATVGIFHWLSHLSLSKMFAELDASGYYGFLKMGALPKIVIIPYLVGLFVLIKETSRVKTLLLYIIFVTFPLLFLYPTEKPELVLLALPFVALISALSYKVFNGKIVAVLLVFVTLEAVSNFWFTEASIKNSNFLRPGWVKQIIQEASAMSTNYNMAFSDDMAEDPMPLIKWYGNFNPQAGYEDIQFPYRFRQTRVSSIRIIGSEDTFYNCGLDKSTYIFATERDLSKIQQDIKIEPVASYKDFLGEERVYLLPPTICVR